MSDFAIYFELGLNHILDINGLDHFLFIVAMIVVYKLSQWKKVLLIVTSFTIAHSLTLILSTLDFITLKQSLIELLIALTIFYTAIENIFDFKLIKYRSLLSGAFGLIHGMGFSSYFKALVPSDFSMIGILFPFNLGIEIGQLIIILILILFMYSISGFYTFKSKYINNTISLLIGIQSLYWIVIRIGA